MAAGELEDQPRVDRAEDGVRAAASTLRSSHSILVAGEVGVEDEPGALADQRPRARPRAARRSAPRCAGPARRARCGPARRCRGSQATTVSRWLVIPIASRLPASALASASACEATRLVTSQISFASCSTQPGPREVLARTRCRRARESVPRRRRPGRWSRSFPGRSRGSRGGNAIARSTTRARSRAAGRRGATKPAERAAGRAVLEVELELGDPVAGADGVDRHPDLHPDSRRRTGAPPAAPPPASPAGRRSAPRPRSRCGCGSPSARSAARSRSRRRPGGGRRRRRGRTGRSRPRRPAARARRPRRRDRRRRRRTGASGAAPSSAASAAAVMLAPLPCGRPRLMTRAPWASATSAVPSLGGVVGDPELDLREGRGEGVERRPDPIRLVAGGDDRQDLRHRAADILPPA